jgi:hypothetical protein
VYTAKGFNIKSTQGSIAHEARHARKRSRRQKIADRTLKLETPTSVPKRGRMTRKVLDVGLTTGERGMRAFVGALVFGIVGGGIALFACGMGLKSEHRGYSESSISTGWLIAAGLVVLGGLIGWFSKRS